MSYLAVHVIFSLKGSSCNNMFRIAFLIFKIISLRWARQKVISFQRGIEIRSGVVCNIVIDWYNLCHQPITWNLVCNTDAYISSRPKEQRKKLHAGEAWYLAVSCLHS